MSKHRLWLQLCGGLTQAVLSWFGACCAFRSGWEEQIPTPVISDKGLWLLLPA